MPRWNVHFETFIQAENPSVLHYGATARALAYTIRGIPVPPSLQKRLHRLNIVRAVRGTTGIEGTDLTEEEVEGVLNTPPTTRALPPSRSRDEQEVRNAERLMTYVEELLRKEPTALLTEGLICEFHRLITASIDYQNNVPGKYRSAQVSAGSYLAPPPEDVPRLMARFVEWFNNGLPRSWDPVVRAIVAHFYLLSIHPFGDGNGRTARGVESFLLYQAGVNARGFYSLANFYYQHRSSYVEMLDHVRFRSDPDLTPFVLFAMGGLVEELEYVHEQLVREVRVISFRDLAREVLEEQHRLGTKAGERQLRFLMELSSEEVAIRDLREGRHRLAHLYRRVGSKTLSRDLSSLNKLNLVVISGGKVRANLERMDEFTASNSPLIALAKPPT